MSKRLKFTLLMTVVSIVAIIFSCKYVLRSFQEPIDMYGKDFDITKDHIGERIEGDVPFSAGQCVQLTKTTSNKGFKTTSETYYYAIPVNGEDPEYYYYICIEVNKKDCKPFDTLAMNFFLGQQGSHKIEGTLKELDDEVYEHTIDYFKDLYPDMSEEELRTYVRPICFEMENYSTAKYILILDIVLLVITIILWVTFILSRRTKNASATNVAYNGEVPTQIPTHMADQYSAQVPSATIGDTSDSSAQNTVYTDNTVTDNQNI